MPAATSKRPVKYRNHWPKPTLSNSSIIAGTPANLEPPAAIKAKATKTERLQRVMRRPLPEEAGSAFVVITRLSFRVFYQLYWCQYSRRQCYDSERWGREARKC